MNLSCIDLDCWSGKSNGALREIRHYLFWQPTCIHVAGDIITVGLVDSRMDFEAEIVRFGQSLKYFIEFENELELY
jgi:hypothetical protein